MKTLIKSILTIISLILIMSLNPIKVEASAPSASEAANSIADIIGVNGSGSSNRVVDGVTSLRTGYLAYLVDENGQVVGDTLAFKSSNFETISGSVFIATSRKGVSVNSWRKDPIPFKLPPYNGNKSTNQAAIKAWMGATNSQGGLNSTQFVYEYWGDEVAKKFKDGELALVLETLMNFKFSYPSNKAKEPPNANGIDIVGYIKRLYNLSDSFSPSMEYISSVRNKLNELLREKWEAEGGNSSEFIPVNPPIIGTVSDIARFYSISVSPNPHWFREYTNKVACFSMMIEAGGIGERFAKFKAWTGSTSSQISDDDLRTYAVGTAVFKVKNDEIQTTYDESKGDTPAAPARESEKSKYNIVKNYRLKEGNSYTDKGCFEITEISNEILIEDEPTYKIVGWKTTTQKGKTNSTNWESSVPGVVIDQGNSASYIQIKDPATTLYILLEEEKEIKEEIPTTNYVLSESSVTRRIWISKPDAQLSMPKIQNHEFIWVLKGHEVTCSGHSYFKEDCYDEDSLEDEDEEPDHCTGHSESCSSFDWKDKTVRLSISNNLKNDYPDILSTKDGWRFETREGGLAKRYFNDGTYERKSTSDETIGNSNWDYVCILLRGQDKLTVADFKNTESTKNDLRDVNSSGFAVGNTPQGKRKTSDYIDRFNLYFVNELSGTDIRTQYGAYSAAPFTKAICNNDRGAVLYTPLSMNDITVKVEVYSGSKSAGINDMSNNNSACLQIPATGFNQSSGRMIQGTQTITFYPYIRMKYDTLTATDKTVYVLGQYMRSISPNSYAEINWNKKSSDNLTLISSQWSTHAQPVNDHGANNVLPGGSNLGLGVKQSDRQMVEVTTYQVAVMGEFETQVTLTGGSNGGLTEELAIQNHEAFVDTVKEGLDDVVIQQYVDKNPTKSNAFDGIQVNSGSDISALGNGSSTSSTEDKYYFRNDGVGNLGNQGDLDVNEEGTSTTYIKISADTSGNILMNGNVVLTKDQDYTALTGEAKLLDERTYIIRKLVKAIERNTGDDNSAKNVNDNHWYNEAVDDLTVVVQRTKLTVGYIDPPERSSVLDPKLIPYTENKSDMFTNYHISQFKTRNYSEYYTTPYVIGTFKNQTIQMRNMDMLFYSRPFYIPNVTTQDLH